MDFLNWLIKNSNFIAAVIAAIAICVSLYTLKKQDTLSRTLASSDFQATQKVKSDIAALIATLRAFVIKAQIINEDKLFNNPSKRTTTGISEDKEKLEDFLCSTTSFALASWIMLLEKKSKKPLKEIQDWRTIALMLGYTLYSVEAYESGMWAQKSLCLLETLNKKDISQISELLDDLPKAIYTMNTNAEYDNALIRGAKSAWCNTVQAASGAPVPESDNESRNNG